MRRGSPSQLDLKHYLLRPHEVKGLQVRKRPLPNCWGSVTGLDLKVDGSDAGLSYLRRGTLLAGDPSCDGRCSSCARVPATLFLFGLIEGRRGRQKSIQEFSRVCRTGRRHSGTCENRIRWDPETQSGGEGRLLRTQHLSGIHGPTIRQQVKS